MTSEQQPSASAGGQASSPGDRPLRVGGRAPRAGDQSLRQLCERVLHDFIADPTRNNLGPGCTDPAWEDFLLGFAAGDDPLWMELKEAAGREHWTPVEAFAASEPGMVSPLPRNSKQPATSWADLACADGTSGSDSAQVAENALPSPSPSELTVISWAVVQTEATKAANREETRVPSERWARARVYGQEANRGLHLAVLTALRANGYRAVAPALLPAWTESDPNTNGWHSNWSERHVAYVAGLGTFGLAGGLITTRGQAVRFGSVLVNAVIPPTQRAYTSPFAYCLHFSGDGCAECAGRCPVGSVSVQGRDKEACVRQLDKAEAYVKLQYGFEGYGCGLCQTGVPCESGIPEGLAPRET